MIEAEKSQVEELKIVLDKERSLIQKVNKVESAYQKAVSMSTSRSCLSTQREEKEDPYLAQMII